MIAGLLFITGCGGNDRLGFYTSTPGNPAEVAIQADRVASRTSEGPLANGNPNERFSEVAPGRVLLVGLCAG